jgi:hypothetical protein
VPKYSTLLLSLCLLFMAVSVSKVSGVLGLLFAIGLGLLAVDCYAHFPNETTVYAQKENFFMKRLFVFVCSSLFVFASFGNASAQSQKSVQSSQTATPPEVSSDQVEIKTDRFSGAITITLKAQTILNTPDQFITMRLEAKFDDQKTKPTTEQAIDILSEGALIYFESLANQPTDFGDKELHFIIDGKPLKIGESSGGKPDKANKPGYKVLKRFTNSLNTDRLKQLAAGKRVEMRLGTYELVLSDEVMTNFRTFVSEFIKRAPSSQHKGKRT